jgi:hypothetical protein
MKEKINFVSLYVGQNKTTTTTAKIIMVSSTIWIYSISVYAVSFGHYTLRNGTVGTNSFN